MFDRFFNLLRWLDGSANLRSVFGPKTLMLTDQRPRGAARKQDSVGVAAPATIPQVASSMRDAVVPIVSNRSRRARVHQAFDASMPVEDRRGLSGRSAELAQLAEGVLDQNKHGIIFGARGSGKTSLSRVFGDVADEARCLVLYHSASGDIDFGALFLPYVEELASGSGIAATKRNDVNPAGMFDARSLAGWMIDNVDRRVILILDEFDRIENATTKSQVASLMKLLSDMRAQVRLLIVGIASDVEDLLQGHPSLRRHVEAVPIGPIAASALRALLDQCCAEAGLGLDDAAADRIVKASLGSPYHLRVFGLHAALAAERGGSTVIDDAVALTALQEALAEWSMISPDSSGYFASLLARADIPREPLSVAAILASYTASFSATSISAGLQDMGRDAATADAWAASTVSLLAPISTESVIEGSFMFTDSLGPQFLKLMTAGIIGRSSAPGSSTVSDMKSVFTSMSEGAL
ncbi:hypothetical protein BH09PSE3_BH09PSE3_04010 [soil metagenome]